MGNIFKGKIAAIEGNTVRVVPSEAGAKPTAKIVIPWHLRGAAGNLQKGTPVVYVEFGDGTGLLLSRADGEWGAYLPSLNVGSITDNGVRLATHTHSGVEPGSKHTGGPE